MKKIRHIVINYLTRHLLKAVTVDDVLQISGKNWIVRKHKFTPDEIVALKEEARSFKDSYLWGLIKKELKYGITLQRYDHAKTDDDMTFGKAMAYSVSQIELFINRISDL